MKRFYIVFIDRQWHPNEVKMEDITYDKVIETAKLVAKEAGAIIVTELEKGKFKPYAVISSKCNVHYL